MERRHACGMGVAFYDRKLVMQMTQDCIWHLREYLKQFLYVHYDLIPSPYTSKSIVTISKKDVPGCLSVILYKYSTSHIHTLTLVVFILV